MRTKNGNSAGKRRLKATVSSDDGFARAPDFLGIGAQKAGTTWLHANLGDHPDLWLPPIKELHYFDELHVEGIRKWSRPQRRQKSRDLLAWYTKSVPAVEWDFRFIAVLTEIALAELDDGWYRKIFRLATSAQICGEVCPDYLLLPDAGVAHLCRVAPDARVIVCLRDPIERNWSHARMMAKTRGVEESTQLETLSLGEGVFERSEYPRLLDRWSRFIDADRMLVIFTDDVATRPAFVLSQVCAHLGVEYREKFFPKAKKVIYAGAPSVIPPAIYQTMKIRLQPVYIELAKRYPEVAGSWFEKHYG